jgi:hypothetical protein
MSSGYALDHDSSRFGRWLRPRRVRLALGIAALEAIVTAVSTSISSITIIALAAVFVPIYFFWGRERSDSTRQISWIAAASQALAAVAVLLAHFIGLLVLILAGVFAAVALVMIFADRR